MLGFVWSVLTLPFRLIVALVELLGRLAALVLGFGLMVVGAALAAGPLFPVGIPVFVVGLLIALRALG
ncbi:MAG TPA: hypothetical protein VG406_26170 [Isosphaeraceae bacterium]|nr:hypothetical protein [Isosphaeraceae bacterium]